MHKQNINLEFRRFIVILLLLMVFSLTGCQTKQHGILQGNVYVGPLSPVERIGVPTSTPPAEVFTSRGIVIRNELGITVKTHYFEPNGTYHVELDAGSYRVDLLPTGIDRAEGLPATVTILANQITQLDIRIDTGIR